MQIPMIFNNTDNTFSIQNQQTCEIELTQGITQVSIPKVYLYETDREIAGFQWGYFTVLKTHSTYSTAEDYANAAATSAASCAYHISQAYLKGNDYQTSTIISAAKAKISKLYQTCLSSSASAVNAYKAYNLFNRGPENSETILWNKYRFALYSKML